MQKCEPSMGQFSKIISFNSKLCRLASLKDITIKQNLETGMMSEILDNTSIRERVTYQKSGSKHLYLD